MTPLREVRDEPPASETSTETTSARLRRSFGPERVALALVAVLVVGLVFASRPGSAGTDVTLAPSPSPAEGSPGVFSPAPAGPDLADVQLALRVNGRIAGAGAALGALLDRPTFDPIAAAELLRTVAADARLGSDVATRIEREPGSAGLGGRLQAYYIRLREISARGLQAALSNEAAYQAASLDMVAVIATGPSIDAELFAALSGSVPSPSSEPSPPPSTSPAPIGSSSPDASASPAPAESAAPSSSPSPTPVPTPAIVNSLRNPDFELGLVDWELVLRESSARASATVDRAIRWAGAASARVDIEVGTESRSAVAFRQSGVLVQAGARYVCRVLVRASGSRDLRVAVVSETGAAYGSRVFPVSSEWTELRFEFTSLVSDAAAVFELDLGRSNDAAWIDAAAFGPPSGGLAP